MLSELSKELIIIMVVKLVALFLIWYVFFSDAHTQINPLTKLLS